MAFALAGCASIGLPSWPSPAAPTQTAKVTPRVQNCGVIDPGTPSRFACDGKVYTSFELAKIREEEAKRYASGQ